MIEIGAPGLTAQAVQEGETDSVRYGKLALFTDPCGHIEFITEGQDAILHCGYPIKADRHRFRLNG